MSDLDRGWSVTRPRDPNYDCEPELTIVVRADSWEQAEELWQGMLIMNGVKPPRRTRRRG